MDKNRTNGGILVAGIEFDDLFTITRDYKKGKRYNPITGQPYMASLPVVNFRIDNEIIYSKDDKDRDSLEWLKKEFLLLFLKEHDAINVFHPNEFQYILGYRVKDLNYVIGIYNEQYLFDQSDIPNISKKLLVLNEFLESVNSSAKGSVYCIDRNTELERK